MCILLHSVSLCSSMNRRYFFVRC
uniref:Uncharacterized protein n=1 Tax=Arundo donax TaxID=35708 RepID=A0A0A9ALR1_ARUDO